MVVEQVLAECRRRKVSVSLSGADLRIIGLQGELPPDLVCRIRENKGEIKHYLRCEELARDIGGRWEVIAVPSWAENYPGLVWQWYGSDDGRTVGVI